MTVHRCHLAPECWQEPEATLSEDESHYVLDVLRLRPGDSINLFDGRGREASAQVMSVPFTRGKAKAGASGRPQVTLRVLNSRHCPPPAPELTLIQAVPKTVRMDWIVEKATELGIRAILPVVSERVVAVAERGEGKDKSERWRRIALSAARQCQTAWIPEIPPVGSFSEVLKNLGGFDLVIMGALTADARPFHEAMDGYRSKPLQRIALVIGPEGDFTPEEYGGLAAHGAVPVSFGALVLRVETAALFGLSVLLYERGLAPDR